MKNFDSAFVNAAMALAKPGDISDKVPGTSYGYYIIRYDSDEQEGAIDINEVKESIQSSLRTTKQNEAYNSTVEKWVEEAGLKVDLNALKD
jgi:peptidyl-prolyl cis-trans isomerase C